MKKRLRVILLTMLSILVIAAFSGCGSSTDSTAEETTTEASADTDSEDTDTEETTTEEETTSSVTVGEQNALDSAESYLSVMAFSYSGLIDQLEYEGYSTDEATYAADNCGADWDEQAAECAESYIEVMSFSRSGLIEQLEYEGFTSEQAEYGATAVGY